ncbi:site-specific DNA-methyltransferase [Mycoplasmopsis gallinarum]
MQQEKDNLIDSENKEKSLKDEYLEKIDNLSTSTFNKDQKELCRTIIRNAKEEDVQNIYQLLIQRIKLGFVFDIASTPITTNKFITLLKENKELSFEGNNFDLNNSKEKDVLIIGENFDVLNNLIVIERERERERAGLDFNYDVIYLDPPYNTEATEKDGNNLANDKENIAASKFIYRDKFSRNGWLNMIRERLIKARTILKENGVIFVSIDDSEQAYLKVLMDEIFGEENFVCNFIWKKKNSGSGSDSKHIRVLTEYILMYAKNQENLKINKEKQDLEDGSYKFYDKWIDSRGKYKLKQLDMASLSWSEKLDYEFEYNNEFYYPGGSKENWLKRKNGLHAEKDWRWRWSKEKLLWGIKNDFIEFKNEKIFTKQYQFVDNEGNLILRESVFSNLILEPNGSLGTQEQKNIFYSKVFDHPKPIELIKFLINLHAKKNARVLDFFAGSGTTAHAVWDLNREDGGNRSVTVVTNNENDIAKNVTYERLHRISLGKATDGSSNFKWLDKNKPYENSLKVYETKQFSIDINESLDEKINLFIQEIADLANVYLDENEDKERILYYLKQLYSLKDNKEQNETN